MFSWLWKQVSLRYDRRLLFYFIIVGFVPILVFAMLAQNISYQAARRQMELQTENTIMNISVSLSSRLSVYEEMLQELSNDESVRTFVATDVGFDEKKEEPSPETSKALRKLYDVVSGKTEYLAAHIVSSQYAAGISTADIPLNYMKPFNQNWGVFRKANESETSVLRTNDYNQNALPGVSFSMAEAIRDGEGNTIGYVVFDVYNEMIEDLLSEIEMSYDMNVYLSDNNHFLLYTAEEEGRSLVDKLPKYLRIGEGEQLTSVYSTEGNEEAYLVAVPLEKYEIWITGEMPLELAAQTGRYVWQAAMLSAVICVFLSIFFVLLAWRDVAAPLRQLTQVFGRVESGELSARVDIQNREDEFGMLGESFNSMADQIEMLIRNVEEKQKSLRVAESSALQAQINPHFLYNTLDLIKWSAKLGKNEDVTKITVMFGRLLRSMANFEKDTVTVEEECEIINNYLGIQAIHYGERLVIEQSIPPEVYEIQIPKLILQPIIENAIVHGIDTQQGIGVLRIKAEYHAPYILFEIEDNGSGIPPEKLKTLLTEKSRSGSIGLQNVDRRARLHGDESCGIQIESILGEGTTVRLRLRAL